MHLLRIKAALFFYLFNSMLYASTQDGNSIKSFKTDYCTAYHEGTRQRPDLWKHCCLEHDLYYWAGGSKEDRSESDLRLKSCIMETGETTQARLMYTGVVVGGYSPIKFRGNEFNNAWPKSRPSYQSLNRDETDLIIDEIETNSQWLSQELRDSFKQQLLYRLEP